MIKMPNKIFCVLFLVCSAFLLQSNKLFAQCTVDAFASKVDIICGDPVTLTAIGDGVTVFEEDFNDGNLDEWVVDPTGTFETNICGSTTADNSQYLWFGNSANAPRDAITPCLDLRTGGLIKWDMRFSGNEGGASCENPDAANEGVYLQYRINNAACNAPGPWQLIEEYQPNGGNDPFRTNWNSYSYRIPDGAKQRYVQIRWVQLNNSNDLLSGDPLDHWGIDDVKIEVNNADANYTWQHTGITKNTGDTPDVTPTQNTTYTVTFSDGTNVCHASVDVNVVKIPVDGISDKYDICPGDPIQLDATDFLGKIPETCGITSDLNCDPIRDESGEIQVGSGNIVNRYNNVDANTFGDFGDAQNRTQIIYRANELKALGFDGGKIKDLFFEIAAIENGQNPNITNLIISMGCTNVNAFGDWVGGLSTVYNRRSYRCAVGWNQFPLDKAFEWDGVSNIVVQVCIFVPHGDSSGDADWGSYTRDNNPGFVSLRQASTNFSDYNDVGCNLTSGSSNENNRPNTRFGFCKPNTSRVPTYVWTPNSGGISNTGIRNPTAAPTSTTTYTVTANTQGYPAACATQDDVTINVQSAPETPIPNYNVGLCEGDALNLLFGTSALPTGAGYSWTGPGGWTSAVKNPTRANASPAMNGSYSVVVSSSAGCPSLAGTINVVVNPAPATPTLGSNSPLCDGEELLLTSSLSGFIYSWTGPTGFTSSVQNPVRNDPAPGMNGQYTLELEDPTTGCKSLNPPTIDVIQNGLPAAPTFTSNKLILCPGEDLVFSTDVPGGFLDPNFDFTFFHNESAWTDNQNGKGAITATRAAVTVAEAGRYGLVIKEAGADCGSDTAWLDITIFDPGSFDASNTGPYCVGEDIELTVTDAGTGSTYSWTGPGGFTANTKDATRAGATLAFAGVYDVEVDNGICSTPINVSTTVSVVEPKDAGNDGNDAVCINSGVIDLFALLGGTPDAGGTWSDDDASGNLAGANFNPLSDGTFNFTYTLAAVGSCPESQSLVTIVVEPMPYAGEDGALTVCNIDQVIDLNSILGGIPQSGGTWANLDGAPAFNPAGSFNPNGEAAGIFNFEYTVNSASGLCQPDVANVAVTIEESPLAGTPSNATICENDNIDLSTLLVGNTPGGTWADDNSSGGLSGTTFTPNQSGSFQFAYTTPAGSACAPVSATVTIVVDELPNPGEDRSTSICEDGGLMDLFNQLGGSPQSGGVWTNLDASSGFIAPNQFDPSGLGGNTYRFEYEMPAAGTCPSQKAIVTVSVLNEPNSGTAVPATICYETVFDLYDALTGYDAGGTWSDDNGSGAFDFPNEFNTSRLNEGSLPRTFHFTYTLNAQGCIEKQTTVDIVVNKPANPGEDTEVTFCQVFGEVDLIDHVNGNPETTGSWSENGGTSSLNNGAINTTTMAPGVYTYQYLVSSPSPCPAQSAQLEVTILEQPSAGNGGNATICSNDIVNLNSFLEEPFTTGGIWSENSDSGGDLNSISGGFDAAGIAQGVYSFVYTIPANNGCEESTSQLTLNVLEAPSIINLTTLCSPDRSTFTVSFDIVNGDDSNYSVNQPGTVTGSSYTSDPIASGSVLTFTVSDGGACGGNSVEVDKSCDCTTQGQSTNTTPLQICDATTVTAPLFGSFVNDSNDVQMFYLHRGVSNFLENPIDSGDSPTFEFDPQTMFFDSVYYISAVVGNELNGYPDKADDCYQVSLGTPVQFFEGTSLIASIDKTVLCPGDVANIHLTFTGGKRPYTIKYRESGFPKTWVVYGTDTLIAVNPSADVSYRLNTLENANGCSYTLTDVFSIDVNTAPMASITNIGDQCAGENPKFFIEVSGDGSLFDVEIDITGHGAETITGIAKPGVEYIPAFLSDESAINFTLLSVKDNSNSICPGQVSGLYTLYPNPMGDITSGSTTICEGTALNIPVTTFGIGPFNITLDDGNGNISTHTITKGVTEIAFGSGLLPGSYSFNIISVADQAFGCNNTGGTGAYDVTVNPGPRATVEALDASGNPVVGPYQMCEGDGAVSLVFRHTQGAGSSFVITYMENGTQQTTTVANGGSNNVAFNPSLGTNTISITKVEDNTSAACAGSGNTITIEMNPKPTASLALVNPEFCDGEDVIIQYSGAGVYPIQAELRDAGNALVQTLTISDATNPTLNLGALPVGTHTYSIGNITDGSTNTCSNVGNSQISVTVLALPTAVFSKSQYTICEGESVDIEQLVSGSGTVSSSINDGSNSYVGSSSAGNILTSISLSAGVYTFGIDSVYDNSSASCVAFPSDQTTLVVQALPTVAMNWDQTPICENMPVNLLVTATGNGPFVLNYRDSEGNNYTENILSGTSSFPFIADKDKSAIGINISDNTVNESGLACTASIANIQAALDVLDRPEATIYGLEKMCEGSSANIYFDITGVGPFSVDFIDNESGQTFTEQFAAATNTYTLNPLDTGIYSIVRVSDSNSPTCDSTGNGVAQINVVTNPNVDFSTALNDSCSPFMVSIAPSIQSDYALANCMWDLGNGVTYNTCDAVDNVYTDLGSYDVSLQVTSVEGCSDSETKSRFINIHPDPVADFDILPSEPTTINSLVQTYNQSSGASIFNWYLDSAIIDNGYQPFLELPTEENALHTICLEAITNYNCRDIVCKEVKVKSVDAVFIPNTFTPDGDNINEVFLPSTIGIVPESFHMEIFNRWGEKVFETHDLAIGWNGMHKGENAKSDMYTVLVHVAPKSNPAKVLVYNGLVTLLR
jgi:gliding motility-associated-like protein